MPSKSFQNQKWVQAVPHGLLPTGLALIAAYAMLAMPALTGVWQPHQTSPFGVIFASLLLGITLAILSAIDLYWQRLPDLLTLPLMAAGLVLCVALQWDDVWMRIAAATLAYFAIYTIAMIYERLRNRPGLGLGDAKLFAAAGAWLGIAGLPAVLLLATGSALFWVVIAALAGKPMTAATRIPLGPFLAFGFWIVWLYGPLDV